MGDNSKIEWTDTTWNPITGCTHAGSPGCDNCYARRFAGRHMGVWGDQSDASNPDRGFRQFSDIQFHESRLALPLHWRKPRRIFVNSMSDLFHPGVPFEWVDCVLAVVALCPQHTFQVLTKRPERMREYMRRVESCVPGGELDYDLWDQWREKEKAHDYEQPAFPLPNLWLGVTICNQADADRHYPAMKALYDAGFRNLFASYEPALGPVDWRPWVGRLMATEEWPAAALECGADRCIDGGILRWAIAGGETGPGARPCHPDWVRGLRAQCQAAGTAFFFKGWGEWAPCDWHREATHAVRDDGRLHKFQHAPLSTERAHEAATSWQGIWKVGKARAGRILDGREWSEFPGNHDKHE